MDRDDSAPNHGFAARIFIEQPLTPDGMAALDADQAHYLNSVLRLGSGDTVALFNGRDGEWIGRIETLAKRGGSLRLERQTRIQAAEIDVWFAFAPIKHARIDFLAEKATELGAAALLPVVTRRTNIARVNTGRLAARAREAAEQCERLSLPRVAEPVPLDRFAADFPAGRRLLLCDETGSAPPIAATLGTTEARATPWAVLVGPEGGFAPEELDLLRRLPFVCPVGLGPRVLRAETAALAALSVFQALAGDGSLRRGGSTPA